MTTCYIELAAEDTKFIRDVIPGIEFIWRLVPRYDFTGINLWRIESPDIPEKLENKLIFLTIMTETDGTKLTYTPVYSMAKDQSKLDILASKKPRKSRNVKN